MVSRNGAEPLLLESCHRGFLRIGGAKQRIIAENTAPQRERQAELELHLILTRVIGPVVTTNCLFIEIAGPCIEQIVALIRIKQERIIMILQQVGDNTARTAGLS